MSNTKTMNVPVTVMKIGTGYVAATQLGGITVRGPRADSEGTAVQNLMWTLGGQGRDSTADDAIMGIELALAGTSFDRMLEKLPERAGDGDTDGF